MFSILDDSLFNWMLSTLIQFSSVQLFSHVQLFATPWIAACQVSLSITNSQSLPKLMSIELVMPSSHLILCCPLLLLLPLPPSIRVFSNESTVRMRWPKYRSFSFSISPSNEHTGLISFWIDWLDLLAVQGTLKSLLLENLSWKHGRITYECGWLFNSSFVSFSVVQRKKPRMGSQESWILVLILPGISWVTLGSLLTELQWSHL